MSNIFPQIPLTVDAHVSKTLSILEQTLQNLCAGISSSLQTAISIVSNNPNYTPQEFWDRVGTQGVTILQELGYWRTILTQKNPDMINQTIAEAGSTLTVNPDGSITVNVPPAP